VCNILVENPEERDQGVGGRIILKRGEISGSHCNVYENYPDDGGSKHL
jgi:hypothetical protein